MSTLPQSSRRFVIATGFDAIFDPLFRLLKSKPARNVLCCIFCTVALLSLLGVWTQRATSVSLPLIHVLIPATRSNPDLCKLLLSAQILGYPTPVLINYGAAEADDPYVQHLAKVDGIFQQLRRLQSSNAHANDLVLILDGYDTWLQLRPSTLRSRYHQINRAADARISSTYGLDVAAADGLRQTIIFGSDKICWPIDFTRPACWAVPFPPLLEHAFGPQTGLGREEHEQPRWLNSGSIMGPVNDLTDLFRATSEKISANHTTDSDQFYFAELFGRQECARLVRRPDLLEQHRTARHGTENLEDGLAAARYCKLEPNQKTEFHIGLDYASSIFQTVAFYKQWLTWMRPEDSWFAEARLDGRGSSPYRYQLPPDITSSVAPTDGIPLDTQDEIGMGKSWSQVDLLYNTATRQTPVLVHFTGEKQFRAIWWQKMWFQKAARILRDHSLQRSPQQKRRLSGSGSHAWLGFASRAPVELIMQERVDGSWSDAGEWLSWDDLCPSPDNMYRVPPDEEFFHPSSGQPESVAS